MKKGVFLAIVLTMLGISGVGQTWPYCISGCDAKDVRISRAYFQNVRVVGGQTFADAYVDFSVTAAQRYCILIAVSFSSESGCTNTQTVWRMFGDLSQGTYTNQ
ncbi:MAG: hypothetical protein ACP5JD_07370, partial [Candidatus Bipolaricaulaceae bacterium]